MRLMHSEDGYSIVSPSFEPPVELLTSMPSIVVRQASTSSSRRYKVQLAIGLVSGSGSSHEPEADFAHPFLRSFMPKSV